MKDYNFKKYVNKIIKEEYDKIVSESGYSRLATIMRGYVPQIHTVGFITAENPNSQTASKEYNKEANKKLELVLRKMNLGFSKVKGKYGNEENSYFVPNIRKDEIIELGKKFKQESVIFGEKIDTKKDDESYTGMNFELIRTNENPGEVISSRKVFINDNNMEDYYSMIKGRKFTIPFFDDIHSQSDWEDSSGIIKKESISEPIIDKLNTLQSVIFEDNRTKKSIWINRGQLKNIINDIKKR